MGQPGPALVFPGGAREVFKHKGEAYQLIWKERFGFVQLAIEHGYTITPLGRYLKRSGIADRYLRGGEEFPPLVRSLGLTAVPRPENLYFPIGRSLEELIAELRAHRAQAKGQGGLRGMLNRL